MTRSVAERLEGARVRLEELGRLTAELASAHPNVFEESELRESLATFNTALREARERLMLDGSKM